MKHKHHHRSKEEPKVTPLAELEELYAATDPPIIPRNGYNPQNKLGTGYKFYTKIREYLAAWWEEFNGDLDKYGRLKHATLRHYIKHKTHKEAERVWLHQMLGPSSTRPEVCAVPWLGDWEKRRRCGFGVLDQPEKIRPLIKMIANNMQAVESIKSLTPVLIEELLQYNSLQKQIHEAFAGQAFLKSGKADEKNNTSRFNTYKTLLWSVTELKIKVIAEIMRVHGVNPNTPEQMRDIAQIAGGVGAAAALTGLAAGQRSLGIGVPSSDGSMIAPFTYDAFKMAEHLTRHAHTFKKPLSAPVIEQEVEEEDSSSSSSKSNGKPQ